MLQSAKLESTLRALSTGAVLMRYVVEAKASIPGAEVAADLLMRALLAPLYTLESLFRGDEVPAKPTKVRTRRLLVAGPPRKTKVVRAGLPEPVNLQGLDKRLPMLVDRRVSASRADMAVEASACRALLMEIVRRAAFDWVLYRGSSDMVKKQYADSAYYWLFEETPVSPAWTTRVRDEKLLTSFTTICTILDWDPDKVRGTIRKMTVRSILNAGRPAERRKGKVADDVMHSEDLRVFDIDVSELPVHDCMFAPEDRHS